MRAAVHWWDCAAAGRNVATADAVQQLLQREAGEPGAAWVSWDEGESAEGLRGEEGCEVAVEALRILQETLVQRMQCT